MSEQLPPTPEKNGGSGPETLIFLALLLQPVMLLLVFQLALLCQPLKT